MFQLSTQDIHLAAQAGSKKEAITQVAAALTQAGCVAAAYVDGMLAREQQTSTYLGNGIAIPHCRLAGCETPISAVLHLESAVDFDAIDGAPVDLLFVLLVPDAATDAHLELLRQIASMLDRSEVRERLRQATSGEALYETVVAVQNEQ